eukprot:1794318-Amphidinium_carterae.1
MATVPELRNLCETGLESSVVTFVVRSLTTSSSQECFCPKDSDAEPTRWSPEAEGKCDFARSQSASI